MRNTFDVVVVGGGIVGAACALAFSRAGMRVALVERDAIGSGATSAAMGQVVVLDDSPAQLALTRYSQLLWQQMASDFPQPVEYFRRGTLWVAADDEEMQEIYRKHRVYSDHGIPCDVLDAQSVARIEPALRPGLGGGFVVHDDVVVLPQVAAEYLLEQAVAAKATRVQGEAIAMGSGKVVLRNGDQLHAPIVVNAAGEWAPALTPGLPVAMRKGHLALSHPYPGFLRYQTVELGYLKSAHIMNADTVAFNVQPRLNGQLLIGSSRQFGVESRGVDDTVLARMFARASEYLPALPTLAIERTWTGFRSSTPDKLPLIGPSADDETLLIATGHEGLGITTSLATGQLLADYLQGKTPAIPLAPYSPSRKIPS